jgi:hypothetical protein
MEKVGRMLPVPTFAFFLLPFSFRPLLDSVAFGQGSEKFRAQHRPQETLLTPQVTRLSEGPGVYGQPFREYHPIPLYRTTPIQRVNILAKGYTPWTGKCASHDRFESPISHKRSFYKRLRIHVILRYPEGSRPSRLPRSRSFGVPQDDA